MTAEFIKRIAVGCLLTIGIAPIPSCIHRPPSSAPVVCSGKNPIGNPSKSVKPSNTATKTPTQATVYENGYSSPVNTNPESSNSVNSLEQPAQTSPTQPFKNEKGLMAKRNLVITASPGDKIVLADDDNVTIKGSGGVVMISGRCIKLKLESSQTEVHCDIANEIEIVGDSNTVTMGTVGNIEVSGNKNSMTWESGFNRGIAPKVSTPGQANKVNQAR